MPDSSASSAPTLALKAFGDPNVDACVGDVCVIPDHHEQAVMNRRLDEDAV